LSEVTATIDYMERYRELEEYANDAPTYHESDLGWVWSHGCGRFEGFYITEAGAVLGASVHLMTCEA